LFYFVGDFGTLRDRNISFIRIHLHTILSVYQVPLPHHLLLILLNISCNDLRHWPRFQENPRKFHIQVFPISDHFRQHSVFLSFPLQSLLLLHPLLLLLQQRCLLLRAILFVALHAFRQYEGPSFVVDDCFGAEFDFELVFGYDEEGFAGGADALGNLRLPEIDDLSDRLVVYTGLVSRG